MATQSLSPEMTSYARLCLAIKDVCTKSFRDILLCNVPSQDIKQAIVARWGHQYNSPKFSKYPFSVLFPNHQLDPNFSVSDCDISLLYFLIRNVSSVQQPLLGWGNSFANNPQDTSIGANVERLHELRNTVFHFKEPSLSNQEFNSYWTKLRDCVTVIDTYLGGTTYQQKLDCLKTDDMDPDFANRIIETFRSSLQDVLAGQQDVREILNQGFHELTIKSEQHSTQLVDLAKDNRQIPQIAEHLNEMDKNMKDKFNEILERIEGKAKENDKTQLQLNSDQGVRTENTTSNQDEHESEITFEKHDSRDSENSTDCNTNCVEKTDVDKSSKSESLAVQVQLKTNDVLVKADHDTNGGIQIDDLASGQDAKLCITKQYVFIKSSLTRESGLEIAKCLLDQKLLSQDAYDRMANTCCARRHPIDILLKKVIHGGKEEIVEAFFKRLQVECPLIARAVKETTITDDDRLRFSQLEARGIETEGPFRIMRSGISERDVSFFKYHLCESEEVVEHITDVMLSRFHFSILDHTRIIDCPASVDRISVLFKTMHLYKLDVATELSGVVKPKLYQKWMESRSTQGSWWSGLYQWIKQSMPEIDSSFKSEEIELTDVERGSIILKFIAGVNFSVDLLKPESLKMKIKTLLKRGCLESKTEPKSVAHITVYIESPPNKDLEEIHIYIDFPATDVSIETEDHQVEMRNRNRDIMLEEMNPARLKKWVLDQPCIHKSHRDMLESKLSEKDRFRQEEMTVLLDFINGLENGDHLLEKYCEKKDLYVYNKVFRKHQESRSQQEEIPGHRAAVTYVKGGGLQKLFSFSIKFNDEDIDPDKEEDEERHLRDIDPDKEEDEDEQLEEIMQKLEALLPMHEDEEQQLKKLIRKKQDKDRRREGDLQKLLELVRNSLGMAHALEDEDEQLEEIMPKLEALLPMHEDEEQQLKNKDRRREVFMPELFEDLQKQRELVRNSLELMPVIKDLMEKQQSKAQALEEFKPVLQEFLQKNLELIENPQDEARQLEDTEQDFFDEFLSKLQEMMLKHKDKEQEHEDSERILKEMKQMQKEFMRKSLDLIRNPQAMERQLQQAIQDPKGFMQKQQGFMQKQQGIVQKQQEFIQMQQECILQLQHDIRKQQEPIQKQQEWMLQFAEGIRELQESIQMQQDLMKMQQDLMRMQQECMLQIEGNILEKKEPIQKQQEWMLQFADLMRMKQKSMLQFAGNILEKLGLSEITHIIKQTGCDEDLSSENNEM